MMRFTTAIAMTIVAALGTSSNVRAQHEATAAADSAAVAAIVVKYHAALAAGDSAAALAMLADDAVILESGGVETRAEYRAGHLPADIRAEKVSRAERSPVRVRLKGDVAWASSTTSTPGTTSGGAELMVMVRDAQSWKIVAIHWSSRRRAG